MGFLARVGECSHSLGCHDLEVPKGAHHLPRRGFRVTSSLPQRHGGPQAYKATRPLHVPKEGPSHGKSVNTLMSSTLVCILIHMYIFYHFAIIMQVTQQVFVAKEQVKNAHDEVNAEAHSRSNAEKVLRALKEEHQELTNKLKGADKEHLSALAGLKNVEAQVEDQRKLLYTTEIELVTQKKLVMDPKAKLQKVKDEAKKAARVAKEATTAVEIASYECGVEDTENRLAKEVAGVCREYCAETWMKVLNSAGVPADFELRKVENIFFLEHIREIPADLSPIALPLPPLEQVPSIQDPTLNARASIRADKGKETLPSAKDTSPEDALTIKDVVSQPKEAESKSKTESAKLKAADSKEGPQSPKKQLQDFFYFNVVSFLLWSLPLFVMYFPFNQ